jgi:hypothetical protein
MNEQDIQVVLTQTPTIEANVGLVQPINVDIVYPGIGGGSVTELVVEIPTGLVNGINNVFSVSEAWYPESVIVFRNGQKIHQSQVTLLTIQSLSLEESPLVGDLIEVQYNKA